DRKILNNVSGEFRSGELTCILGPSGAGKSSLLNILAGYTSNGVHGRITVNGLTRDMRVFKKLSTYIMQDDLLQPRLTVEEILQTLGLLNHKDTMSERLSGGQSKRLSVALELVNNPPIIFLDEPTTGLDIVSIRQLVVLLRLLSRQGRTIICTVHQPSASLFTLFDRIYVLARGMCCYQGAPQLLVSYLAEAGHICPTTHNPADFVLETLIGDVEVAAHLSELSQNGKLCRKLDRLAARGGSIFFKIGNDGSIPIVNFKFCLSCVVFFMYTYIMIPILLSDPGDYLHDNHLPNVGTAAGVGQVSALHTCYLRYGLSAFSLALYSNRGLMECPDTFCLYNDPKLLLRDVGMTNDSYVIQLVALVAFTAGHRILAYFALRYTLTAEFSSKFMCYVSKVLKRNV
ncbi:putative the eye pigment transporter, partial [Operophtera brumata]